MKDEKIGVIIKDRNFEVGQQIRDALKDGKRLFLLRKPEWKKKRLEKLVDGV